MLATCGCAGASLRSRGCPPRSTDLGANYASGRMIRDTGGALRSWRGPIAQIDVDIDESAVDVSVDAVYSRATLRMRRADGTLVGLAPDVPVDEGTVPVAAILSAIDSLAPPPERLTTPPAPLRWPSMTVVVCTRGRGQRVLSTLDAFQALDYRGPLEILVIENAPQSDDLRTIIEARAASSGQRIRYETEPRPGLSRARNRALELAQGDLIAFTDDDAVPEPGWAAAIASTIALDEGVGAVAGLTLPAEIETPAQEWCEMFDAFNSGRRFDRVIYRESDPGTHPLYPFPLRIAGVNMGFRRELLRRIGGFEPALGAGTRSAGGEDTAVAAEVLLHGYDIRYEPAAVVRHTHRRGEADLLSMMYGYGTGGAAYMSWCLHRHPVRSLGLTRRIPDAVRYFVTRGGSHDTGGREQIPAYLTRATRRGMARGPAAYLGEVRTERRTSGLSPQPA